MATDAGPTAQGAALSRQALAARVTRFVPAGVKPSAYGWFVAAAAYVVLMTVSASALSWDTWAALVIVPVLFTITVPLLWRGLRADPDPGIARLVVFAFAAKMTGAVLRYVLTFELYAGRADADGYHGAGMRLAHAFWDGNLDRAMSADVPELTGTSFVNLVTGVVYTITGPTKLGGFIVFSWFSFLGLFFFYKALTVGFPEANHRRYALLVFFLPSLLYWPSSLGKDAWICFSLGLASYGVALIMQHQPLGYPVAALGLLGTAGPRLHITVLCFASLVSAYLLRRRSWSDSRMGPIPKALGIVVLLVAGSAVVSRTAAFFDLDGGGADSATVDQVFNRAGAQSAQGGSEFEPVRVKSPVEFPEAVMAVVFRPWPWEASNGQSLIAAAEGTMLLVLAVLSVRRLMRLPRHLFRVPYVAYAVAYTTMFVIAFSSISNFGIMTRQRTQVLPLLLVLLVLPEESAPVERRTPTLEERARELARRTARPSRLS